jgi:hypothetical protein
VLGEGPIFALVLAPAVVNNPLWTPSIPHLDPL